LVFVGGDLESVRDGLDAASPFGAKEWLDVYGSQARLELDMDDLKNGSCLQKARRKR
jgi:hypothetical protein